MNLVQWKKPVISSEPGKVTFNDYEAYKSQALQLSQYIEAIDVTEENVKLAKKLLAQVNKSVKILEDRRIEIKKEMLIPYTLFESQIKEIVGIVKGADEAVRSQVRDLEEVARDEKADTLKEIWKLRIQQYPFTFVEFEDFLQAGHLNKTVSVAKVEAEMVEFLEGIDKDLKVINAMPNKKEILEVYMDSLSLATALALSQERYQKQVEVARHYQEEVEERDYMIRVFSEKDLTLATLLLAQNGIRYDVY